MTREEEEEEERNQEAFEDRAGCFLGEAIGCAGGALIPFLLVGLWWM